MPKDGWVPKTEISGISRPIRQLSYRVISAEGRVRRKSPRGAAILADIDSYRIRAIRFWSRTVLIGRACLAATVEMGLVVADDSRKGSPLGEGDVDARRAGVHEPSLEGFCGVPARWRSSPGTIGPELTGSCAITRNRFPREDDYL